MEGGKALCELCSYLTSIIFGVSCAIVLVWCYFFVPETRGVGLGRPMDELFGFDSKAGADEEEHEPTERTGLLERPSVGRKLSTIEQILASEHDRRKMSLC